jgi:hypothetical protein
MHKTILKVVASSDIRNIDLVGLSTGAYSVVSIDKEYSKTLPKRAAEGYKSSNQQIMNHPYFRNLNR